MQEKAYRAVFFDLDGTLLPMDIDEFMQAYFGAINGFVQAKGLDGESFNAALHAGVRAMATSDDSSLNADKFWGTFFTRVEGGRDTWMPLLEDFYEHDFGTIGAGVVPNRHVARSIDTLLGKGYPLVLATMPMFPLRAVQWRLEWAGVDPGAFKRLTTFDNSTSVKPKLAYYQENLAAGGLEGPDVLMVGNNTHEDLACMGTGMDAFLVTDHLLNPNGFDVSSVRHGSFEDFAAWADALPACSDPASFEAAGGASPPSVPQAAGAMDPVPATRGR